MNIGLDSHFRSEISSLLEGNKRRKKSALKLGGVSLNALLLAGCGGGTSPTPQPKQVEVPTDFTQSGTTFTSTGNTDSTLSEGSSTTDLTVTSADGDDTITTGTGSDTIATGAGDDTITAGAGDDVIHAGAGSDTIAGGEGNDTIVLIGTTTAGQYSSSSITNSAGGADMSSVLNSESLNNNTVSEVGAGEIIDGGAGNDALVIYGTAYINQATLLNLDEMWVNSEVILTGEQFAMFGSFKGDGASVLRVRSNDLEPITAETDDTPGGNQGHGNNTDGQDDNNPGQGDGGPNIRDKDGDDEDEAGGGTTTDGTTTDGTTIDPIAPTVVDISTIYIADIGTLSLEGNITLIADDMHDFAGVINVNGDGSTNVMLNGDPDLTTTDFDLSAVNFSGIAELELNGNWNIIVRNANDYFGIGSIAVSGLADITLTIDSSTNTGLTAAYDFTASPLAAVDTVKVYGDTKLAFSGSEQFATTQIIGVTDSLTIAFVSAADGTASEILVSSLSAHLYGIDTVELGANVTLVLDDQTTLASIGSPAIAGFGTVIIDRTNMTDDALVTYMLGVQFGESVSVIDTSGNDLLSLLPSAEVTGTAGDDIYEGTVGETIYVFAPVDGTFGHDIVHDFDLAYDKIDISATLLNFNEIEQVVTADGLQIQTTQGWILLSGLTAPLTTESFILNDVSGPVISNVSISQTVDMDVDQTVDISITASDADGLAGTALATFTTPSGDTLELELLLGVGVASFDATTFTEEGIYTLVSVSAADINGNINSLTLNSDFTVFNINATNNSNIIGGTHDSENLSGTDSNDIIVGRMGDDTLTGGGGNDRFVYLDGYYVNAPETEYYTSYWGLDTITDFSEGDTLDFSMTNWTEGFFQILYAQDSTIIWRGDDQIVLEGFTGVLTNIGTANDPILAVMSEEERLDANHQADLRPPSYNGITLPATVNLDEDIRFYFDIDITDDIAGAWAVTLKFQHVDGHYFWINANFSSDFEGFDELSEWFAPGTYNLVSITGRDFEYNSFSYNAADIEALGLSQSIEVVNSTPDLLDPIVSSITLSQDTLDLGLSSDRLYVSINAIDDMSGIEKIYIKFTGPNGDITSNYYYPKYGLVGLVSMNPWFESGMYTITSISVWDNVGHRNNIQGQALADAGLDISFELINPTEDITPPVLNDVASENGIVFLIGISDELAITSSFTDDLSGVSFISYSFNGPDGIGKTHNANNIDSLGNFYIRGIDATFWPEGTYTLSQVTIKDRGSNLETYYMEELSLAEISFSFEVVAPLIINGTVEDDLLIGGDGYDVFVMGENFGNDTIESFTLGYDYVDLRSSGIIFTEISQSVNGEGLLLENGTNSILIKGLTQTLNDGYLLTAPPPTPSLELISLTVVETQVDMQGAASLTVSVVAEGATYVAVSFTNASGYEIFAQWDPSKFESFEIALDEWEHDGDYTINRVSISNQGGYIRYDDPTQLNLMGITPEFTVINAINDTLAPVLEGFTISTTSIEAGIENTINFSISVSDDLSGTSRFELVYADPDGNRLVLALTDSHQFIGGTSFADFTIPGTYTIVELKGLDYAGNWTTTYYTADLEAMGFQTTFEVTNFHEDTVAPVLNSITLNQAYYDSGNEYADPLIAYIDVNETGSGFYRSFIYFQNESGTNYGSNTNLSFAGSVNNFGAPGVYTLSQVTIDDIANNRSSYYTDQLTDMGVSYTIRVLGDGTQPGVAVGGTGEIDDIVGTRENEVFTLYLGEDTVSFGADWGHDTIADFVQGDDVLDFSGSGLTYADLTINDTSYGLFINDDNDNDLLLQGFDGELQAGDALFATTNGTFDADVMLAGPLETIEAGPGDDIITITEDNFNSIDGGSDIDALVISGDGLDGIEGMIDLSGLVARGAVLNFEHIDIANGLSDTLLLTADQVIAMTDGGNVMVIDGDVGDTLNSQGEGWIANGTTVVGGVDYNVYTSGLATIHVDPEIELILS